MTESDDAPTPTERFEDLAKRLFQIVKEDVTDDEGGPKPEEPDPAD